jgi:hypothetical protein
VYGAGDCDEDSKISHVEESFTYTLFNRDYVGEEPQAYEYQLTNVNITLYNHSASEHYRDLLNGTCCVDWAKNYEHQIPDECDEACGLSNVKDGFPLSKTRVAKVQVRGISADPAGVKEGFTSQYCEMRVSDSAADAASVDMTAFAENVCSHEQVQSGDTSNCANVADVMRDCLLQTCNADPHGKAWYTVLLVVLVVLGPFGAGVAVCYCVRKANAKDEASAYTRNADETGNDAEASSDGLEITTTGARQAAVM